MFGFDVHEIIDILAQHLEDKIKMPLIKCPACDGTRVISKKGGWKCMECRHEWILGYQMPTKHTMTRAEAITMLKNHMPLSDSAERTIDFYVAAGMLELKEEEEKPVFEIISPEQVLHIKIYKNGKIEGISGTIINRIPELIAKLKQNNS